MRPMNHLSFFLVVGLLGFPVQASGPVTLPDTIDFYCQGVSCYRPNGQYIGTLRALADQQDRDGEVLDILSNHPTVNALVAELSHEVVYGKTDLCQNKACRRDLGRQQYEAQVILYNTVYEALLEEGSDALLEDDALIEVLLRSKLNNL